MQAFKIFVGYDSREDAAWQVCRFSLMRHAKAKLQVQPIRLSEVKAAGLYTRPIDVNASTEFSISRFLTPALAASRSWSMFVDCDFLFTADVGNILENLSPDKAVYVVQHDYQPAHALKMDGRVQHSYPRKNWSSLMLFNGRHPKVQALTPDVVNQATPSYLHRFEWLDDDEIGELSMDWNFLVGEYSKPDFTPRAIHYTNGGPWFSQWRDVDYAELWMQEQMLMDKQKNAAASSRLPSFGLANALS